MLNSSNISLARKCRSAQFKDVLGQDVVIQIIKNALQKNQLGSAILFYGIRGIGKTSIARLIAKAVNCDAYQDFLKNPTSELPDLPCNKCSNCLEISEERHSDFLEIDAASNTSVDDIRPIIESAKYFPQKARIKVYIIDEVHMLSKSAFNALLKTLEEPPAHVMFILATTEISKVPVTIVSRCMRFELKPLDDAVLIPHLSKIAKEHNVTIEDDALKFITNIAEHSARDSLSLLEQLILSGKELFDLKAVQSLFGMCSLEEIVDMFEQIIQGKDLEAIKISRNLLGSGISEESIINKLLEIVHKIMTLELEEANDQAIIDFSKKVSKEHLINLWSILLGGIESLKLTTSVRIALEATIIKCALVFGNNKQINNTKAQIATPPANVNPKTNNSSAKFIGSYEELIELFKSKKEAILVSYLENNLRLVKFNPPYIEWFVDGEIPKDFNANIIRKVQEWTGQIWFIENSSNKPEMPTKGEEREIQKQLDLKKSLEDPLAKSFLESFPYAKIIK